MFDFYTSWKHQKTGGFQGVWKWNTGWIWVKKAMAWMICLQRSLLIFLHIPATNELQSMDHGINM